MFSVYLFTFFFTIFFLLQKPSETLVKNCGEERLDKKYTWINFESQNLVKFAGKCNIDFKVSEWNVLSTLLTAVFFIRHNKACLFLLKKYG